MNALSPILTGALTLAGNPDSETPIVEQTYFSAS